MITDLIHKDGIKMLEKVGNINNEYKLTDKKGESFIHAIDARTKRRLGEDYALKGGDVIRIVAAKGR